MKWSVSRLRYLADTIRLPNFPSVASNVLVALVVVASRVSCSGFSTWLYFLAVVLALALYASGNLLNDWADRDWDALHRPERALPRQVFSSSSYLSLAVGLMFACLVGAFFVSRELFYLCGGIIASILLYTCIHKRSVWAVVPMATCRAALPWLGLFALMPPSQAPSPVCFCLAAHSAALFIHTVSISLSSRLVQAFRMNVVAITVAAAFGLLSALLACAGAAWLPGTPLWLALLASLPYGLAVLRSFSPFLLSPPGRRVCWLLACFPLLDAVLWIASAWSLPLMPCIGSLAAPCLFFALTIQLQRWSTAT